MRSAGVERPSMLAALAGALVAALVSSVGAQNADVPRAPRILNRPIAEPTAPSPTSESATAPVPVLVPFIGQRRPPNAARLAPLPEERSDEPEEIVVIGRGWRLPDLGSEWRAKQKESEGSGRFIATALPLYDPSDPPLHTEAFRAPEQRRHGYIELFRLRFGRRSSE